MMSTTLAEHLNNIQTLGGPKYCSGQIEICVKYFFLVIQPSGTSVFFRYNCDQALPTPL